MMVGYLRRCRAARLPPRHQTSLCVGAGSAYGGAAGEGATAPLGYRLATKPHYAWGLGALQGALQGALPRRYETSVWMGVHKKRMRKAIRRLTISHSPLSSGGADGTRTRDPRRDRPVF